MSLQVGDNLTVLDIDESEGTAIVVDDSGTKYCIDLDLTDIINEQSPEIIDTNQPLDGEFHNFQLPNGQQLIVQQNTDGTLSVGCRDKHGDVPVDWWLCQIRKDGVLVYPNSGDACENLLVRLDANSR